MNHANMNLRRFRPSEREDDNTRLLVGLGYVPILFFLPLIVAGIHLAFAFPILEKLLHVLMLSSTSLFVLCSLITFGVFAGVYVVIYLGTARTYYKIVK